MVIAGRLEGDVARAVQGPQQCDKPLDLDPHILNPQRASLAREQFQQHLVRQLATSIATRTTGDVVENSGVMAGSLLWSELWQTHSREALVLP